MAEQPKDRKVTHKDGIMTVEYPGGIKAQTNMSDADEMERKIAAAIEAELSGARQPSKEKAK
jgi:hypothetical protein